MANVTNTNKVLCTIALILLIITLLYGLVTLAKLNIFISQMANLLQMQTLALKSL